MALGLEKYYEQGETSLLTEGWKNSILLTAYGFGSQLGHAFKECATTAADNRALELAFLDGFLSTRVKVENPSARKKGFAFMPKEGL